MRRERSAARAFLALAVLVHLAFLASLLLGYAVDHPRGGKHSPRPDDPADFHRWGFLNDLFNDAAPYMYGQGADFFIVLSSGKMLMEGRSMYPFFPHPDVPYAYIPYPYLPTIGAVVGLLFHWFRPWVAYWIWVVIGELLLGLNLLMARRACRLEAPEVFPWVAGMWLAYFPLYVELFIGQFNLLLATTIHAFLLAALLHRERLLILAWAAGIWTKLVPALFGLALVRYRRWRALTIGSILAGLPVLLYFLAFPQLGLHPAPLALRLLGFEQVPVPLGFLTILDHLSAGAVKPMYAGSPSFGNLLHLAVRDPAIHRGIRTTFLLAALTVMVLRRRDLSLSCGLLLGSVFLYYHHPWEHHYVLALPLLGLLVIRGGPTRWVALGVWFLLAIPTPYILYGTRRITSPLYYLPKSAGAVGLYVALIWAHLARQPGDPHASSGEPASGEFGDSRLSPRDRSSLPRSPAGR